MENRTTAAVRSEDKAPLKKARDFEPPDAVPPQPNDPPAGPPHSYDCDDLTDSRPSHGKPKARD